MRALNLAALIATMSFVPAEASAASYEVNYDTNSTVIQTDCECLSYTPFEPFDTSLGSIYRATLEVTVVKHDLWQVDVPSGSADPIHVDWSANGLWTFASAFSSNLKMTLTGAGSEDLPILGDYGYSENNRSYSGFMTDLYGHRTYDLNVALLLPNPDNYLWYSGSYAGQYTGAGTTVTSTVNDFHAFVIKDQPIGDDGNGTTFYKLTYYFKPGGTQAIVPEPSTWAMILLGFGAVGFALRRRKLAPA